MLYYWLMLHALLIIKHETSLIQLRLVQTLEVENISVHEMFFLFYILNFQYMKVDPSCFDSGRILRVRVEEF